MPKSRRKKKYDWAVFAIDPGGTTGVCEALIPRRLTVADSMRNARLRPYEVWAQNPLDQSVHIALNYLNFVFKVQEKHHIPLSRIRLTIESFQLRQRNVQLEPVQIHWALQGLLYQHDVTWTEQTPSQSKTFATNARLHDWGCYQVGSEHKRDAVRHVALAVVALIGQDSSRPSS